MFFWKQVVSDIQKFGWSTFQLSFTSKEEFAHLVLLLSSSLGQPVSTRKNGCLVEELRPKDTKNAYLNSLSHQHSLGAFPLHIDTAHWITPCKYILLACIDPGEGGRQTLLLDTLSVRLSFDQRNAIYSEPFKVINGKSSFFGTILAEGRPFVRLDVGCMHPTSTKGKEILDWFSSETQKENIKAIDWQAGKVLIINNWRMLHGRTSINIPDEKRTLIRITLK